MNQFSPQRLRHGAVVQSGMNRTPRDWQPRYTPRQGPYRAVVINTFVHEDGIPRRVTQVACDVILTSSLLPLPRVPVVQRNYGVNNVHGMWAPKPSTRLISTGKDFTLRAVGRDGARTGNPPPLGDLDGDHVLVDYVEGDIGYPVIVGALPHEATNREILNASGTRGSPGKDEYYVHHQGAEVRVDEKGNVLIDTVAAYADGATEETAGGEGDIRLRLKRSRKLTIEVDGDDMIEIYEEAGVVKVDLVEGATESLVLGDTFATLFNGHTHTSPAGGSTGPPNGTAPLPPGTPGIMGAAHLSSRVRTK